MSLKFLSHLFPGLSVVLSILCFRKRIPFIQWSSREPQQKTMVMQFIKHFGKRCCVIIDCYEVFIERPSNLKARAETWSSYKHHNTIKCLIEITPQKTISFYSEKLIVDHSGFLNNTHPGDLILADIGFDMMDSVATLCAQVNIPAFKGANQLSPSDV